MAALSVVDVDLGKMAPVFIIGALGLGAWYLWQRNKQQEQIAQSQAQASPLAMYQAAADLSLLRSFTGNQTQTVGGGGPTNTNPAAPVYDPALPTYSAPGNSTQNFTQPANGLQSIAASASSNGI